MEMMAEHTFILFSIVCGQSMRLNNKVVHVLKSKVVFSDTLVNVEVLFLMLKLIALYVVTYNRVTYNFMLTACKQPQWLSYDTGLSSSTLGQSGTIIWQCETVSQKTGPHYFYLSFSHVDTSSKDTQIVSANLVSLRPIGAIGTKTGMAPPNRIAGTRRVISRVAISHRMASAPICYCAVAVRYANNLIVYFKTSLSMLLNAKQ